MAQRWTEIGAGVFVRRHRSLDLNVGAVLADDGVVIIDTRESPLAAGDLVESLHRITRLPVRWVINTHHHWDHTFGNQVFTEAAIWGHEACATAMRERGEAMRQRVKALAPDIADAMDGVEITPPEFTFSDSIAMTLGGTPVEMRHLGRGHTDNDIVVSLPQAGVLFAGDLIEQGAPPSFGDSFPLEWPETLATLLPLAGEIVVPGHGAVVNNDFVAAQRDELEIVARLARQRHADGMTPAEAAAGSGPYTQETLASAFERAWAHLEAA